MNNCNEIKTLIREGYAVFNVTDKKRPVCPAWGKLTTAELRPYQNVNSTRWGFRMGMQENGRHIISIDFDCCGSPDANGKRSGCEYTRSKLAEFMAFGKTDGVFQSSTAGNMNVLVDITYCPALIAKIGDRSKYKRAGTDLEMLLGSGHQQVIPPTATICKLSGEMGQPRTWLGSNPFLVLAPMTPVYQFIMDLLEEPEVVVPKPAPKKATVAVTDTEESVSDNEAVAPDDKYMDLLINVIGNDNLHWDDYFAVMGVLKSCGYSAEQFMQWAGMAGKCNHHKAMKDWVTLKTTKMSIFTLQNLAKRINPDGYKDWLDRNRDAMRVAETDNDASDMILEELAGKILTDHWGRVWLKQGNIWTGDLPVIENALKLHLLRSGISRKVGEKDGKISTKPYTQNVSATEAVCKAIIIKAKVELVDSTLYDKFRNTTRNRLCFLDGVLDIAQRRFYLWDELPFVVYTTVCIQFAFGEYFQSPNREVMAEVHETVFQNLFHNKTDVALHYFARALAGNNEDKTWGTYMGDRNCGKGVLFDLFRYAFEEYVTDFEPNNLMYERKRDMEEVSRKNYWLLDFEHARLAISQEIPFGDNLQADGMKIKSICSGGDVKRAKRNYDRVDTRFKPQSSLFMMGNNELVLDEADVLQHCVQFTGHVQFKSQEFIDQVRAEYPDRPEMVSMYRVKDDDVKTVKVPSREWSLATIMLLVEAWRPCAVVIPKEAGDMLQGETSLKIRAELTEIFELTYNVSDMELVSTVEESLPKWPKKKLTSALEQMGIKKVKSSTKEYRLKWVYIGLKRKVVEEGVEEVEE